MAKGGRKGDSRPGGHGRKPRRAPVDPLFFPMVRTFSRSDIVDGDPAKLGIRDVGNLPRIMRLPGETPRLIAMKPGRLPFFSTATLIPVSHLRSLVGRMIAKGEIRPENAVGTIKALERKTNELIPEHIPPDRMEDSPYQMGCRIHGQHLSPLIALRAGRGVCQDWAAVYTALARAAGLQAGIAGDPNFNRGAGQEGAYHVWPVVTASPKLRVHVDTPRRAMGLSEADSRVLYGRVKDGMRRELIDPRGKTRLFHQEYVPEIPVEVPLSVRTSLLDILGE